MFNTRSSEISIQSQILDTDLDFLSPAEASAWASSHTGSDVTLANIQYLVKYNRIRSIKKNGVLAIHFGDLETYFRSRNRNRELAYKSKLGDDVNWHLSFDQYKESETTKHVHRLHPYKGKFIPQLVEYFLDTHTDEFKTQPYFAPGDIVLDPFCGSGTTLVQANELSIHGIGVDVSAFNTLISNLKLSGLDPLKISLATQEVSNEIANSDSGIRARKFESALLVELKEFNLKYFPAPEFRVKVKLGELDEAQYSADKERGFLDRYEKLLLEFDVADNTSSYPNKFLDYWFLPSILDEISFALKVIEELDDPVIANLLRLILSRTARSCRATTHYDLATLVQPISKTYYCSKHNKICKPLFSCLKWWNRYSSDTVKRIDQFSKLRTNTSQLCLTGDSRNINIPLQLQDKNKELTNLYKNQGIRGIFSSPPYVGLIDYHEQHAYAYELFGFPRNDAAEIGPLAEGQGKQARTDYVNGIAEVLVNSRKFMVEDFDVFLVANDKFQLYPEIASLADMKIINEYKRPVLNRAEGNKGAYSESIFHLINA